jgi:hypothetical protein
MRRFRSIARLLPLLAILAALTAGMLLAREAARRVGFWAPTRLDWGAPPSRDRVVHASPADLAGALESRDAYRVGVIDLFYPGDDAFASEDERQEALLSHDAIDIDGDRRRDPYYHGDVVSLYVASKRIEVVAYPIREVASPKPEILGHLRHIADGDGRPHAVILAWESSTLLSAFGEPVEAERGRAYKQVVRYWAEQSESWQLTWEIIRAMEDLVDAGVEVFTIAGNAGRGVVNTYSFAEGVHTVGAAEPDADGRWVARNAFVDSVAQGVYQVRLVRGVWGEPMGYDLNEDGVADVPVDRVSHRRGLREQGAILRGSSFAAPTALRLLRR